MNKLGKYILGISLAMASALLIAFSFPVLETNKVYAELDNKDYVQVEDIYFTEDCTSCRYITVYDENDRLVYDKLVIDTNNITDTKLKKILKESDFLMSNSITDFYILSK